MLVSDENDKNVQKQKCIQETRQRSWVGARGSKMVAGKGDCDWMGKKRGKWAMEGENDAAFHSSLYQLPPNPSLQSSIPVGNRTACGSRKAAK